MHHGQSAAPGAPMHCLKVLAEVFSLHVTLTLSPPSHGSAPASGRTAQAPACVQYEPASQSMSRAQAPTGPQWPSPMHTIGATQPPIAHDGTHTDASHTVPGLDAQSPSTLQPDGIGWRQSG